MIAIAGFVLVSRLQRDEEILRVEDAMKAVPEIVLEGDGAIEQAEIRTRDAKEKTFLVRMLPSGWTAVWEEKSSWRCDRPS